MKYVGSYFEGIVAFSLLQPAPPDVSAGKTMDVMQVCRNGNSVSFLKERLLSDNT
jgi:hypothetical protein